MKNGGVSLTWGQVNSQAEVYLGGMGVAGNHVWSLVIVAEAMYGALS